MRGRQLQAEDGDLAVIAGAPNLRQQLEHRIATPQGQARRHPEYGCLLHRLLGAVNGPTAGLLGAEYVKTALRSDYRIQSVEYATAEVRGDVLRVQARAAAIEGGVVDLRMES
jgi:phage baseplate assembly protein W